MSLWEDNGKRAACRIDSPWPVSGSWLIGASLHGGLSPQCLFFYIFENLIQKHEMALNPVRSFCNEKQNSTVSWGSVETGSPIYTPYPLSFNFLWGTHTYSMDPQIKSQSLENPQVWRDLLWNVVFDYICAYYLLLMVKTFDVFVCRAAGV